MKISNEDELKILVDENKTPNRIRKKFNLAKNKKIIINRKRKLLDFLKINKKEIFFIVLFNITYINSLTRCYDSDEVCINKYRYLLYVLPLLMIFSMSIWLFYVIYHLKKREYFYIFFWIVNLLIFYVFFRGYKWKEHGGFNMLLSSNIIFWYGFFYLFYTLFKKFFYSKKKLFIFIVFCFIVLNIFFFITRFLLTIDKFYKGFNNTKLINNNKLCKFKNFYLNWHEGTKGFFLFFPLIFSNCNKNYVPNWKNEGLIYQYPDTRKFDIQTRRYSVSMSRKVQSEMKVLKKGETPTGEFWVDFTNGNPEFKMKIIPDLELVKKKKKLIEKNKINKNFKGLYILFIDALSRANFLRMYPKVFNILEKYYNNKESNYEVFQFFRFHSRKPWTSPNVGMWRYGNKFWSDNTKKIFPKLKNIETELSEKGYITAHADGFCKTRVINYDIGDEVEKNIQESHWDHEFIAPTCDEEIFDNNDPYGPFVGPYSSVRRCLFGNDVSGYMLDYIGKFHESYRNEKTICSVELSDNHELTREVPRYIEGKLVEHFERIFEGDLLNGKSNVFLADHGQHMTPIIKDFVSGVVEQFNPMLFLVLPRDIADQYRGILRENEQKLIGMRDVRKVMFFLATGEVFNSEGVNFVTDIVDESRLPSEIDVEKEDWQCLKNDY